MFKNYILVTLRKIVKQKAYAFINITGLAIGLAVCILIMLYVVHELSYDRFHANADRIYRIGVEGNLSGEFVKYPLSNLGTGPAMLKDFPEVVAFTRLYSRSKMPVKYDENVFYEERLAYADPHFFEVFSFPLLRGDQKTALEAPYSIVLSRDMAAKYFGTEDPLNKRLKLNSRTDYNVTGVMENIPENSHLKLDFLCSIESYYVNNGRNVEEWNSFNNYTYLLLSDTADPSALTEKFPSFIDSYMATIKKIIGGSLNFFIQPITDIHLRSNLGYEIPGGGDIAYVYIFSAIALLILIIACINFMNLSTARSAGRAKEVGLRKVMGAEKGMLIRQFLVESILYCVIAFVLALAIIWIVSPVFSSLSGVKIGYLLRQMPWLLPAFIGFTLITGLLAGSYPAFFLSAFEPAKVLRGTLKSGAAGSRFRSVLVVSQFVISIALLAGAGVMLSQLRFMKNKDLGFDKENIIVLPIREQSIRENLQAVKNEIRSYNQVMDVSAASDLPGDTPDYSAFVPEGYTIEQTQLMHSINVDTDLVKTLGMEIVAGRDFSADFPTDPEKSVIINETAARQYNWDDPIGKTIGFFKTAGLKELEYRRVIGVVKDFHVRSMHDKILPLLLTVQPDYLQEMAVRIKPGATSGALEFLKEKWARLDPNRPFDYYFLDSNFNRQYQADEKLNTIIGYFTLFALFVACLGLFGMASFMAERRFKEIGIRKTLGATVPDIVVLISKEVAKLILIAGIVACPIAYLGLHRWMESFAYRTGISVFTFLIATAIVFLVGYLTISYQSIKAALLNPVDAIRTE